LQGVLAILVRVAVIALLVLGATACASEPAASATPDTGKEKTLNPCIYNGFRAVIGVVIQDFLKSLVIPMVSAQPIGVTYIFDEAKSIFGNLNYGKDQK